MSHTTLISATELQALLAGSRPPLLIDASFDLADTAAGERAYAAGHLPGAHYLHLDRDLSGAKAGEGQVFTGRHPLPAPGDFARRLAALGLAAGQQVVAYDSQGGMYAARVWWMLRWMGHEAVAVLDGGAAAWQSAGGALVTDVPAVSSGSFQASASMAPSLDADALQAQLGRVRLLDARAGERYRGEVEPLDRQAGHIPGALNRFFKDNLQADGRFKAPDALRAEFEALLPPFTASEVVHQCGSGVTACHNLLAMTHAGLPGSRLYPGSWSEWSADPRRPVAQG